MKDNITDVLSVKIVHFYNLFLFDINVQLSQHLCSHQDMPMPPRKNIMLARENKLFACDCGTYLR